MFLNLLSKTSYINIKLRHFKVDSDTIASLAFVVVEHFTICTINLAMRFNFGGVQQNTDKIL